MDISTHCRIEWYRFECETLTLTLHYSGVAPACAILLLSSVPLHRRQRVHGQCRAAMSTRQYCDSELTMQQKCPLLLPQNIPHAVQDDFSSIADDASINVLDLGVLNDEFKVTERSSKPCRLNYKDFIPGRTGSWDKSETFQ